MKVRDDEWQELSKRALEILEKPALLLNAVDLRHFRPVLRLAHHPTFGDEKIWVFYRPRPQIDPQPKPRINSITWNKRADRERLFQPLAGLREGFHLSPTFEVSSAEIEKRDFEELLNGLSKIEMPPFLPDEMLGLDGEHFEAETLGNYHSAKVKWWSVYSEEWRELADWFDKATEKAKACLESGA